MPLENTTTVTLETSAVDANGWLVNSIIAVVHYATEREGEDNITGNIEIGDILLKDAQGVYIKEEKLAIGWIRKLDDEVIDIKHQELTPEELITLMTNHPDGREAFKTIGYDALKVINEAVAEAVYS